MTYSLRGYQQTAVEAALRSPRSLLALPTGTGKTVVMAEVTRRTHGRVLLIAHRRELLEQARDTIHAHAERYVGFWVGNRRRIANTMVASVASLHSRTRDKLPKPDLLLIDEAHHATAWTYRKIIEWAGCKVVGVTATPYRLDEDEEGTWKLGEIFGERPAYTYPLMDAVRDGYLVPIRQWGVETQCSLDDVKLSHGDLAASGLLAIDTPERNLLVAESYQRLCKGRRAIVFAAGVAHAKNLATALRATGARARAIWGEMPQAERNGILGMYRRGELDAVCNCGILTEGFDDPATSALLMARPTTSRGLYTQMAGRGLRPHDGKEDCLIIDFLDVGKRHQLSLQSAIKLAGLPGEVAHSEQDAEGRMVVEVAQEHLQRLEDLQELLKVQPLKWVARDITPRWSASQLSLAGYEPTQVWERKPATDKQLKTIKRFKFQPQRDLSRGEASALIDRLFTLDKEEPELATAKQVSYLRWKGLLKGPAHELTKREAMRMIARSKR